MQIPDSYTSALATDLSFIRGPSKLFSKKPQLTVLIGHEEVIFFFICSKVSKPRSFHLGVFLAIMPSAAPQACQSRGPTAFPLPPHHSPPSPDAHVMGSLWKGVLFSIHFWKRPESHLGAELPLAAQCRPWVLSDSVSPGITLEADEGLMSRENSHAQSYPENFLQNVPWVAFNWAIHHLAHRKAQHPSVLVPGWTPWFLCLFSVEHGACHGSQCRTHRVLSHWRRISRLLLAVTLALQPKPPNDQPNAQSRKLWGCFESLESSPVPASWWDDGDLEVRVWRTV